MRSMTGGHQVRADAIGWFYSPLILADQKWFHPSIDFLVNGQLIDPIPAPPYEEYHPAVVNRFYGRYPYEPQLNQPSKEKNLADDYN